MFRFISTNRFFNIIRTQALFIVLIPFLLACEKAETPPKSNSEKLYVEFTVDGERKVVISQVVDSTVRVMPSASYTNLSNSDYKYKVEHGMELTSDQKVNLHFTTFTDVYSSTGWDTKNNPYYGTFRSKLVSNPVTFFPNFSENRLAIQLSYYDLVNGKYYQSYKLRNVNGTISPIDGSQNASDFKITRHVRYTSSDPIWAYAESELIEGTFNMKLYSPSNDSIMVTDGKFKIYLVL